MDFACPKTRWILFKVYHDQKRIGLEIKGLRVFLEGELPSLTRKIELENTILKCLRKTL